MTAPLYSLDWLAMALTFLALWQIGNGQRVGFVLMITANSAWMGVGLLTGSTAMVTANTVFALMNIRALLRWASTATN